MDPNTYSTGSSSTSPSTGESAGRSAGQSTGLAALAGELEGLAAQDLDSLTDAALAERVLRLRRLVDRLEGHWLAELAAVDARGAAGAEAGVQAPSTAGWLRTRLRLGAGAASSCVQTARALFRGPLTQTGQALTNGEVSVAHAAVLAAGTQDLPVPTAIDAEPVLLEAARRLDPPRLRRVVAHLQLVADPDTAQATTDRQHERRGLWLTPTFEGMVAVDGLLEPEAGQTVLAALEPLARPPALRTPAAVASAGPMPSMSWPAGPWRAAGCPRPVGSAPADGDHRPGEPARPPRPWGGGRGGRPGRTVGPGGVSAAGL
jgi:Domain of unknown function (DUF222)